jgi:ferric-dicitrate binding protein FerR (iron transport regulator)
MLDLDSRLQRGPLKVGSLWTPERPALVARRALKRRRRVAVAVGAIGLCALALVALVAPSRRTHAPAVASVPAGDVRFADGSGAKMLVQNTDLRVEEDSPRRVVARLTGSARFDVVPNPGRTFEVRTGDVRVRVLGTAFSLEQADPGRTRVAVASTFVPLITLAWMPPISTTRLPQLVRFKAMDPTPPLELNEESAMPGLV